MIVFVGEANPHGGPEYALYHMPRGAAGDRLRAHLGLRDSTYHAIEKVNLCNQAWSWPIARARAWDLLVTTKQRVVVALGAKVRDALEGPGFFEADRMLRDLTLVTLPHPSGRNLLWNDPDARRRARELLREHAPGIPWGETDEVSAEEVTT